MARILFVCLGNTCRSPMAEAIARQLHPTHEFASRGLMRPGGLPISPDAERLLRGRFGRDTSSHRSRSLEVEDLEAHDLVVCLDEAVGRHLAERAPELGERLVTWHIADPVGRGYEAYVAAADELEARIAGLATSAG